MTSNRLHADDPRLTAYALGELDLAERSAIERELSLRPELWAEVEQIQRTAGLLGRALDDDPRPAEVTGEHIERRRPRRAFRKLVAAAGIATAAASVLLVVLYSAPQRESSIASYFSESADSAVADESVATHLAYAPKRRPGGIDLDAGMVFKDGAVTYPSSARLPIRTEDRSERWSRISDAVPRNPGPAEPMLGKRMMFGVGVVAEAEAIRPSPQLDGEQVPGRFGELPGTESYNAIVENPFIPPEGEQALSTFSIDVDTASYSNVRRFLTHGQLPPRDAVRIEELVNYFDYSYPQPPDGVPFSVATEVGPCPWQPEHRLVRIGLKGREIEREQRPVSNLVFLLDVSGSMQPENKLPLVKAGMELLVEQLNENDRISIVTYAGNAGLLLAPTPGDDKQTILSAIRSLQAGGSTNGEAGIKLAYTQAIRNFSEHGSNRVILCTDGDFNVGVSSDDELVAMIQEKAKQSRVYLSIFGFGMGNLKDAKLEQLANKGNGHYGYIDDLREAKKVFSEELMGTLYTIAKDVKIQVEFNPQRVGAYRLIGYENRALANRDFTDDTKDAGEIGAGHTVTALYEVAPVGKVPAADTVDLKYQKPEGRGQEAGVRRQVPEEFRNELLTVKLRYKLPNADSSIPLEFPLVDDPGRSLQASRDFDWAAAVAAFGMVLRDSRYKGQANLGLVRELVEGALGAESSENRREFLDLIDAARSLIKSGEQEGTSR